MRARSMEPPAGVRHRRLTAVLPAYNEVARIGETLHALDRHLAAHVPASDIIVVDDGSSDGTADYVRRVASDLSTPLVVIPSTPNRGKGYAVRLGMLAASGELVLMTDADLATPIGELGKLLAAVREGAEVAIGSRKMPGAVVERHQPRLREGMGRMFSALARLFVVEVSDVTCGFKVFTYAAAREIFSRTTLDDWSFDAEALFLARHLGFRLREVPVRWHDVPGTKVRRGRDAVRAAIGLLRIRVNAMQGRYGAKRRDDRRAVELPASIAQS